MGNILPNFIRAALNGNGRPIYHRWPVKIVYKAIACDFLRECENEIRYTCQWIRQEVDKPTEVQDWHAINRHVQLLDRMLIRRREILSRIQQIA